MTRYHSDEDTRRYDLMKVGVLLLLLALLVLTWLITRDGTLPELTEEGAQATPAGEVGQAATAYPDAGEPGEVASLPAPTLAAPVIDAPSGALPPGEVTLSGTAGPGAQVVILVNGNRAAAAIAGVDGQWSATTNLPVGDYVVQAQVLDNVGSVVSESEPLDLSISDSAVTEATPALSTPEFDSVTGNYVFSGMAAPGDTVTITSNGTTVGTATADEAGNWTIAVPAEAVTGDVSLQTTDAAGNVTFETGAISLESRPPSISPPGELQVDPATGEAVMPIQAGSFTWTGQGEPGTRVEVIVDGVSIGAADVDDAGQWSLATELPAGSHSVQLNSLSSSGEVLAEGTPFTVVAREGPAVAESTPAPEPTAALTTEATAAAPEATAPATGDQTIGGVLQSQPEFSSFWAAAEASGLAAALAEQGPFTVFAPTNDAFARLPQRVIDGLNANPQLLLEVLQYHVARGRYLATDLVVVQPATLNGRLLTIFTQGDTMMVNDAVVTSADNIVENGVIHAIDRILVPPLAVGVRPPIIDESGAPTFAGSQLTVVGTAEPNRTILVELNGEAFGEPATVGPDGAWSVSGTVTPGEYQIVAYMLGAADALEAISRPVTLQVTQ
jgi:uncharacterized surface protein with fasciclin (FAS1) repeats